MERQNLCGAGYGTDTNYSNNSSFVLAGPLTIHNTWVAWTKYAGLINTLRRCKLAPRNP